MTSGRRSIDPPLCRVTLGGRMGGHVRPFVVRLPAAGPADRTLMVEPDSAEPIWKTRAACRGSASCVSGASGNGGGGGPGLYETQFAIDVRLPLPARLSGLRGRVLARADIIEGAATPRVRGDKAMTLRFIVGRILREWPARGLVGGGRPARERARRLHQGRKPASRSRPYPWPHGSRRSDGRRRRLRDLRPDRTDRGPSTRASTTSCRRTGPRKS